MPEEDLGPMPDPKIEPGEPNPGGADAQPDDSGPIAIPDLSPDENPALDDRAPETVKKEVKEGEDTSTEATESDEGEDADHKPEKEAPA